MHGLGYLFFTCSLQAMDYGKTLRCHALPPAQEHPRWPSLPSHHFPCKPAPDVIFTALKALNAKPEDCLFVGDSPADMEAGRRAGVKICAAHYGYGASDVAA